MRLKHTSRLFCFFIFLITACGSTKPIITMTPEINSGGESTITPTIDFQPSQTPVNTETPASNNGPDENIILIIVKNQLVLTHPDGQTPVVFNISGNIIGAGLSPDGKLIAYETEEQLTHVIYLLDVDTGQSTQVSHDLILGLPDVMLWSRNEDQLFLSCTIGGSFDYQIYSMNMTSGVMTPLTNFSLNNPDATLALDSWSSDEGTFGFTTSVTPPQGGYSKGSLQVLDIKNKQIKTVLDEQNSGEITHISDTSITPDGKTIFFVGKRDGHHRIFRIDLDGTNLEEFSSNDLTIDIIGFIVFDPEGKFFFAYAADQNENNPNLVPTLFSIDGALIRQLSDYPGRVVSWIKAGQ